MEPYFWRIAKPKTGNEYRPELEALTNLKKTAADIWKEIPQKFWVTALFPGDGTRCGYLPSNVFEVEKSALWEERKSPVLPLRNKVWHPVMRHRTARCEEFDTDAGR